MFTTGIKKRPHRELWSEEEDINVLRARLTIRLEGLKRYRQGRPGFTGTNIQKIEALEGLKLVDGLEKLRVQSADLPDNNVVSKTDLGLPSS